MFVSCATRDVFPVLNTADIWHAEARNIPNSSKLAEVLMLGVSILEMPASNIGRDTEYLN